MGLRVTVSPIQNTFYVIMVLLGILGNAIVVGVIGESVFRGPGGGRRSDIVLINMALSSLLLSVFRNILLVLSDLGLELVISGGWCRLLMGVWVWLRSVNGWSTLFLSAFHFLTLRRVAPPSGTIQRRRRTPRTLLGCLVLVWSLNIIYSIPAHIYSTNGNKNTTETLMLISSTTRPLLGCVWNFPSSNASTAFATTSMVVHEVLPIVLMAVTNSGSLYILYSHGKTRSATHKVPVERRAAKVIVALTVLFISSWVTIIISINLINYRKGLSVEHLLVIARFANTAFIAISPVVLAAGHGRLRAVVKSVIY
ncbi:hypothetical protein DPEC_G00211800 [Dallia pectoralis]|uniref:Uncharacterized protein n=1 Tax=Dallia pectoralis TaxID=75939 RepID=A0ACC2G6F4_DALPE|nr:hypothetical protein DPEC_G00211800 [Dallia pectoralis]